MSVCNQTSDLPQLWHINLESEQRISWEQNPVGWYPVDVLFLPACRELLFVSTIYYLYTYLYCDTLPGEPFAENAPTHTYTGRGNIFPLQSPRLCAHTHFHTNLPQKMHTSHSALPPRPSPVTTKQAIRWRDTKRRDLSTTLHILSFPVFQSAILIPVCFFSDCHSQLSTCNVRSRSPHPSEFCQDKQTQEERHSMCWLSHICQVVHKIYQSPASRKERPWVSFIEHCREQCEDWLTDRFTDIM